jgi:hypothetical protein
VVLLPVVNALAITSPMSTVAEVAVRLLEAQVKIDAIIEEAIPDSEWPLLPPSVFDPDRREFVQAEISTLESHPEDYDSRSVTGILQLIEHCSGVDSGLLEACRSHKALWSGVSELPPLRIGSADAEAALDSKSALSFAALRKELVVDRVLGVSIQARCDRMLSTGARLLHSASVLTLACCALPAVVRALPITATTHEIDAAIALQEAALQMYDIVEDTFGGKEWDVPRTYYDPDSSDFIRASVSYTREHRGLSSGGALLRLLQAIDRCPLTQASTLPWHKTLQALRPQAEKNAWCEAHYLCADSCDSSMVEEVKVSNP